MSSVTRRNHTQPTGLPTPPHYTTVRQDSGREVIVIEDTPPIETRSAKRARHSGSSASGASNLATRAAYTYRDPPFRTSSSATNGRNGARTEQQAQAPPLTNGYAAKYQAAQLPAQVQQLAHAGPSNGMGVPAAPAAKPAAVASRKRKVAQETPASSYASRVPPPPIASSSALPCDDKEGHFIVRPGEFLDRGRYRIIRLLGQGTFGKVVEAFYFKEQRTVAVKIIRAIQKYRDASKVEIKVLNLLRERDPKNSNKCIHMLDCFDDRGHICISSELLSVSVFDFLKDNSYAPFPDSQIQDFARQLLSSVAFVHDCRLIHTDLKPENILLVDNDARDVPLKRGSSKTKKVLRSSEIRLIDFGSATFQDEYHASVVSTRHYRAPEIILGLGWSYPCDVWSVGCILVEFYTGEALFQTHENLEHLAMMEVVFGRMPAHLQRAAQRARPEWFRPDKKLDFPQSSTSKQSRKFVKAMKPLREIVQPTSIVNHRFLDLLEKLLTWDPKERLTIREALTHPYFALKIDDEGSAVAQPAP
ncbi:uncharacterized protein L969DRAFT_95135 [Mixia osmundae IAM 14324]|uniref:Protein kinase domain-containing protein n=1 Tax=Mixia osmundae (strain CBS 9802 / IAM 14324 / JCM 22182 / KY 12970) TaxID=764103 RepID=G7E729_MIXOS|nr:uncharacterized protein L969DRAFT_95135 [Mixia osmundae IAM 14324]KEI38978.1 hypothetical protein L969DRAFT_95135 [Mixia osmundae IAM 14324]GAA98639.1 hypothetical protein E5Q_05326 [Mixia osmundae IAM 14324]